MEAALEATEALVPAKIPTVWTTSIRISSPVRPASSCGQRRWRAAASTPSRHPMATATHGQGVGPGTQRRSPVTRTGWPPASRSTCQAGTTACWRLGAALTCGGSVAPIQWARWSCQTAVSPSPTRRQSGAASALASAGGGAHLEPCAGVDDLDLQAGHGGLDGQDAGLVVAGLGAADRVRGRRGGAEPREQRCRGHDRRRPARPPPTPGDGLRSCVHGLTLNWVAATTWLAKGAWSAATNSTRTLWVPASSVGSFWVSP